MNKKITGFMRNLGLLDQASSFNPGEHSHLYVNNLIKPEGFGLLLGLTMNKKITGFMRNLGLLDQASSFNPGEHSHLYVNNLCFRTGVSRDLATLSLHNFEVLPERARAIFNSIAAGGVPSAEPAAVAKEDTGWVEHEVGTNEPESESSLPENPTEAAAEGTTEEVPEGVSDVTTDAQGTTEETEQSLVPPAPGGKKNKGR